MKNSYTPIKDSAGKINKTLCDTREAVNQRFPTVFIILTTFGLVATLYGFERVLDTIPVFAENPYILLGTGIIILLFTGTLYKKLQ
jgi:hypothetical protein